MSFFIKKKNNKGIFKIPGYNVLWIVCTLCSLLYKPMELHSLTKEWIWSTEQAKGKPKMQMNSSVAKNTLKNKAHHVTYKDI